MDDKSHAYYNRLLRQYVDGTISNEDRFVLEKHALDDPFLFEALEGLQQKGKENKASIANLKNNIASKANLKKETKRIPLFNYGIAASLILLLGAGMWFLNYNLDTHESVVMNTPAQEVSAQTEKAAGNESESVEDLALEHAESKPIISTPDIKIEKNNNQYDSPKAKISQDEQVANASDKSDTNEASFVNAVADNSAIPTIKEDLDLVAIPTDKNKKVSKISTELKNRKLESNKPLKTEVVRNAKTQSAAKDTPQEFSEEIVSDNESVTQDVNKKESNAKVNQAELILERSEYVNTLEGNRLAAPEEGISILRNKIKNVPQKLKQENSSAESILIQFYINEEGETSSFEVISGENQDCINRIISIIQYGSKWITAPSNSPVKLQLKLSCN